MRPRSIQRRLTATIVVLGAAVAVTIVALPAPAGADPDPGPGPRPVPVGLTQIFVSDQSIPDWSDNGGLTQVDSSTGARSLLSDNDNPAGGPSFQSPGAITFDSGGNLLVAEAFDTPIGVQETPAVIRVDRITGVRTLVSSNAAPAGGSAFHGPSGIAVEADGNILVADPYAFRLGAGGVIRVHPVTGARTTLSRNNAPAGGPSFAHPTDIAVAANGDVFVVDGGGVIRVDPVSGARTLVSSNTSPAGGPDFANPGYLTLDAAGDILVSDWGADRIIRVNPVTGIRTTVSDNADPVGGPSFVFPGDLVADCGTILVADTGAHAVLRVDSVTGVRTTVSDNTSASGPFFNQIFGIAVRRTAECVLMPHFQTVMPSTPTVRD